MSMRPSTFFHRGHLQAGSFERGRDLALGVRLGIVHHDLTPGFSHDFTESLQVAEFDETVQRVIEYGRMRLPFPVPRAERKSSRVIPLLQGDSPT